MRFTDRGPGSKACALPDGGHIATPAYDSRNPQVAILMCTYNGASFLRQQLDSIGEQTIKSWTIYVSDDGSTDATLELLAEYQGRWGNHRLVVFEGPGEGFARNFMSLIQRSEIEADYFAFSDQDDIWFCRKLERSLGHLTTQNFEIPALYCSRTQLVDARGGPMGFSPLYRKPPTFQNALVQSIAGANTMMINRAARALLARVPEGSKLVAHDWLTYLLITGCGGKAFYDPHPSLGYRQHGGNLIGANATFSDRLARLRQMASGRFVTWNDANAAILKRMCLLLTEENREVLAFFDVGRKSGFWRRLNSVYRSGVYRQTLGDNVSLFLAACLGKI